MSSEERVMPVVQLDKEGMTRSILECFKKSSEMLEAMRDTELDPEVLIGRDENTSLEKSMDQEEYLYAYTIIHRILRVTDYRSSEGNVSAWIVVKNTDTRNDECLEQKNNFTTPEIEKLNNLGWNIGIPEFAKKLDEARGAPAALLYLNSAKKMGKPRLAVATFEGIANKRRRTLSHYKTWKTK